MVSPLFEAATTLSIIRPDELSDKVDLSGKTILEKMALFKSIGVPVVICGAISAFSVSLLERNKIQVVPWIRGPVADVISAYKNGQLTSMRCFALPGCGRRGYGKCHGKGGYRPNCNHPFK